MILELHERDAKVLEQILSILKNHPEIEKFEIDEEPMVSLPGLEIFPSRRKVFRDRQEIQLTAKEYRNRFTNRSGAISLQETKTIR